jgi:hypothetical protein
MKNVEGASNWQLLYSASLVRGHVLQLSSLNPALILRPGLAIGANFMLSLVSGRWLHRTHPSSYNSIYWIILLSQSM